MTQERVLLVDDEEEFVETLAKRLKARGLKVETAESGEAAIARVEQGQFDVIVLDLAMPGLDGMETFRRISQHNDELQVIFLTGHGSIQTAFQAMKLGAADFLEKPAAFQDLLEKIEEAGQRKALLLEQRAEQHVSELLKKHGW